MTEYSGQPNLRGERVSPPFGACTVSVMPKRGPYLRDKKTIAPQRRRTFIKEWRLFREMTVEELADKADMSTGNISAIENRRQGYSDDSLARLAEALRTTPGALLTVDPSDPTTGDFWHTWGQASADQRRQLSEIAKTIVISRARK
jgi:transcriptional regulator with XRE-family HTH domain